MGSERPGTFVCPECGTAYVRGAKYCAHCGRFLNVDDAADLRTPLPPGTLVGSYRLRGLLGEGGMGRVYSGEHVKLGRLVAVKMLRPELVANPASVARFFAEARAVNQISHENIVEITDFVEQPGGDNCLIMELLRGEDLGQRLARKHALPLARALDIASQVASALSAVHAAGIVHRDLKPDNIFLIERSGSTDFVKLLDFGVAKLSDPSGSGGIAMHSTAAGQIIGTPEYMSPEQASGQAIDHRTDIYSLGVILYEMVTGSLPFTAKSFGELLLKHMTAPIAVPARDPALPPGVQSARDQLLRDLLAKDPKDRPRTMDDVDRRLGDVMDALGMARRPIKKRASTSGPERAIADPPAASPAPAATREPPERRRTPPADRPIQIARTVTPVGGETVARVKLTSTRSDLALQAEAARARAGERIAKSSSEDAGRRLAKSSTESEPLAIASEPRLAKASAESPPLDMPRTTSRGVDFETPTTGEKKLPRARTEPPVDPRNSVGRASGQSPAIVEIDRRRETRGDDDRVAKPRPDSTGDGRPRADGAGDRDAPPQRTGSDGPSAKRTDVATRQGRDQDRTDDRSAKRTEGATRAGREDRTDDRSAKRTDGAARAGSDERAKRSSAARTNGNADATAASHAATQPIARPIAPRHTPVAAWVAAAATVVALGAVGWIVLHRDDGSPRAPATVQPPPAPTEVRIKFVSAPSNATVRIAGTHEILCTTPCTKTFPRGDLAIAFEISKDGYMMATQTASLASNDAIATALAPVTALAPAPPVSPPPTPAAPRPEHGHATASPPAKVDRDGTMDVFPK